jgi:hypothetical protein
MPRNMSSGKFTELMSTGSGLQYSLLYSVLVNPVLSLILSKTGEDKPVNKH